MRLVDISRGVAAAAILAAGATVAGLGAAPAGAAVKAGGPWAGLQAQALAAVATHDGADSVLAVPGMAPSGGTGTVTTLSGQVLSSVSRTVLATEGSKEVFVTMTLIGGRQLLVSAAPTTGGPATFLALKPGTSHISDQTGTTATVTYDRAPSGTTTSGATAPPLSAPTLSVAGTPDGSYPAGWGCYIFIYGPGVIGSVFGPLIDFEAGASCASANSIDLMISGYEAGYSGSTQIASAGGSAYTSYYFLNAYAPCSPTGGSTNQFWTALLEQINGTFGGGTSGSSWLACYLD